MEFAGPFRARRHSERAVVMAAILPFRRPPWCIRCHGFIDVSRMGFWNLYCEIRQRSPMISGLLNQLFRAFGDLTTTRIP